MNDISKKALLDNAEFSNLSAEEQSVISNLVNYSGSFGDIRYTDIVKTAEKSDKRNISVAQLSDKDKYTDKRINSIVLENFRTFSRMDGKTPFGLNFLRSNEPCSLFLMGANGTGKSSIYSALEFLYSGQCSHSSEMHCEILNYLTYGFERVYNISSKNVSLKAKTNDKSELSGLESISFNVPPVFFCSDYDVECMKEKGNNLFKYFLQQMGYQDLIDSFDALDRIRKDLLNTKSHFASSSDELTSAEYQLIIDEFLGFIFSKEGKLQEIKAYSDVENIKEDEINKHHKLFEIKWEILEKYRHVNPEENKSELYTLFDSTSEVSNVESPNSTETKTDFYKDAEHLSMLYRTLWDVCKKYESSSTRKVADLLENLFKQKTTKELQEAQDLIGIEGEHEIDVNIDIIEKCRMFLKMVQQQIVDNFVLSYGTEIQDILTKNSSEGENFLLTSSAGAIKLTVTVNKGTNSEFQASVFEYLNTFRFKIFCLMFKISMSIYWMNLNKVIIPIVIDDIFNATDFDNRLKLDYVVYSIYKMYETKILQPYRKCSIPLQLIMFTHDEVVLGAFKNGFLYMSENDFLTCHYSRHSKFDMICGRLLSCKQAAELYKMKHSERSYINLYADEL